MHDIPFALDKSSQLDTVGKETKRKVKRDEDLKFQGQYLLCLKLY